MGNGERTGLDLSEEPSDRLKEIQCPPTGTGYIAEIDGVLEPIHIDDDLFLASRMSDRLRAEQGWFEKLVTHQPSVGTFYEDSLRSILGELLPSKHKIGTGFIFDPDKRKNSKQLDILIYNDSNNAPLYKRGEFVVIQPSMAVSQSEVKKSLKLSDVRKIISDTALSYYGNHPLSPPRCHHINVFAFTASAKTDKIFDSVASSIRNMAEVLRGKTASGLDVNFSTMGFVLPNFYFFDRDRFIETRLIKSGHLFNVEIIEYKSSLDTGFNEFLCAMTETEDDSRNIQRRNFLTHPLRPIVVRSELIETKISLIQRLTMCMLLKLFPSDSQEIKKFRINGKRPFQVMASSAIDLDRIKNFSEFKRISDLSWQWVNPDFQAAEADG